MKEGNGGKVVIRIILLMIIMAVGYALSFWECDRCEERVRGEKYKYVGSQETICEDCYQFLKRTGQIIDVD